MLACILGNVKETKPWCEMAFPGRREERAQRRLTSSPSGKKLHYKNYRSTIFQRKETKDILEDSNSTMIKKEQTQWQDDGTVLSLPPWAWCKAQCHEPNYTAEYFHQAPPDSPPHTLAGLGMARRWGLPFCPLILWEECECLSLVHIHFIYSYIHSLQFFLMYTFALVKVYVDLNQ